jgi:enoyl-CoA hydratase
LIFLRRNPSASELAPAPHAGLVSKVFPKEKTVEEAVKAGEKIAAMSKPITALCKEAVNAAYELTLREGTHFERRIFHATFASVCYNALRND